MSKNIIYIIATPKNGKLNNEYRLSIEAWKAWGLQHGIETYVLEQPLVDPRYMHIIWQRYYLFDLLDANGIQADQVLMVDADTIPHPNCPNFFEQTDNKYCFVHDDGSYDWILRGMEHYASSVFKGEWFPFYEYGNSGFQIVNRKHRSFFDEMIQLYNSNVDEIKRIQASYGIGTDQTPLNFMLRRHNIDYKILPYQYNMTCMPKKEILDENLTFTKCGWVYHFNGLPNKDISVPYWMEKTYKTLYG